MISAIIVAAGKGSRMGGPRRKQFLNLGDRSILAHTLQVFDDSPIIDTIILVLPQVDMQFFLDEVLPQAGLRRSPRLVEGGTRRQESVWNGLAAIENQEGLVLIHDGVRPLVSPQLIAAVAEGARKWGACIPSIPAVETLKEVDGQGMVIQTHSRDRFRMAQTPQGFQLAIIREAHEMARRAGVVATDDAFVVEALGKKVHTISGERKNIKITTPEDLALAEAYLKQNDQAKSFHHVSN